MKKKSHITFWTGLGKSHYREQLGIAAHLCAAHSRYGMLPICNLNIYVIPALLHRQIGFVFDEYNNPIAYLVWAFIAADVESKIIAGKPLHPSEWNEGEQLWIVDFVAPFGNVREIVNFLRMTQFLDRTSAHSFRRNTLNDPRGKVRVWDHNKRTTRLNLIPQVSRPAIPRRSILQPPDGSEDV